MYMKQYTDANIIIHNDLFCIRIYSRVRRMGGGQMIDWIYSRVRRMGGGQMINCQREAR